MQKNFKFILFIILVALFKTSYGQTTSYKDVLLNGREAKLNLSTGEFIFVGSDGNDSIVKAKKTDEDFSIDRLNFHIVQSAENLETIGKQYGLSASELKKANKLKSTKVSVGQKLRVRKFDEEDLANSEDVWIVAKGDALYGISRKSKVSIDTIKRLNGLKGNNLSIGQKLYLK